MWRGQSGAQLTSRDVAKEQQAQTEIPRGRHATTVDERSKFGDIEIVELKGDGTLEHHLINRNRLGDPFDRIKMLYHFKIWGPIRLVFPS